MKEINFFRFSWIKLIVLLIIMFLSWYLSGKFALIGSTQPFIVKFFIIVFIITLIYLIISIIYSLIFKLKK